jgi:exopolysaccharide biosynthesis polyprenyl glycosylphosphotransferase
MSASDSVTPGVYADALVTSYRAARGAHKHSFRQMLVAVEMVADFVTCASGVWAACLLDVSLHGGAIHHPGREVATLSIMAGLFAVLGLKKDGAYAGGGSLLQIRETERALRISVQLVLLLLPLSLLPSAAVSGTAVLIAPVTVAIALMLQKQAFLSIIRLLHRDDFGVQRVVLYGAGDTGRRIVSALLHSLRLGLRPVAVVDDQPGPHGSSVFEMGYRGRRTVPSHAGPVTTAFLNASGCNMLILATATLSPERVAAAANAARLAGIKVAFLSSPEFHEHRGTASIDLDGFIVTSMIEPSTSWFYTAGKRVLDLVLSSLLLVILSPLLLLIALSVKLDSPGPIFFTQKRVGRNGELFKIFKFRSMYADSPQYEASPYSSSDPRITRIGRLLRRLSLDELPQFVNVILGDMSLVGPRPEMPFIVQGYSSEQRERLQVSPGITGLWQLSADRAFPIHENVQYDLYYIRNRGFFMDLAILIHTLFFAMRGGI